jgi:hypothetical protein
MGGLGTLDMWSVSWYFMSLEKAEAQMHIAVFVGQQPSRTLAQ